MPLSASLNSTWMLVNARAVVLPLAGRLTRLNTVGGVSSPESPGNSMAPMSK